jgi:hypothetical protein
MGRIGWKAGKIKIMIKIAIKMEGMDGWTMEAVV